MLGVQSVPKVCLIMYRQAPGKEEGGGRHLTELLATSLVILGTERSSHGYLKFWHVILVLWS